MKTYRYYTLDDDDVSPIAITVTEEEIIRLYSNQDSISKEDCIRDFIRMYWAWEVER